MKKFAIDATLVRTFGLVAESFSGVGVFLLVVNLINNFVQFFLRGLMAVGISPASPAAMFATPWYWLNLALSIGITALLAAGGTAGMLRVARGETVSAGDCLSAGIERLLPMLGLIVLWYLGIVVGMVLLVVPGIVVMLMWFVVMPVMMGEGAGIGESFGRSRALTKGSRWRLLGLLLLAGVMIAAVAGLAVLVMGIPFAAMARSMQASLPAMLVFGLLGWAATLFMLALTVASYLELAEVHGEGPQGLSAVFV